LRAVAYRMLGSLTEAEDAVQDAWLRLSRSEAGAVENMRGFLTTVVARLCLDALRARKSRSEELGVEEPLAAASAPAGPTTPEHEAELADSVGLALLVVLESLDPAERLAFVLHDLFAVPFDEIAAIVGRSPDAARQLASRARRRVQGAPAVPEAALSEQRSVVSAFLTALRGGDLAALIAVLDPDVHVQMDTPAGKREVRGAVTWASGAVAFGHMAVAARLALVNGAVGLVVAPKGRLSRALIFTLDAGKIAAVEIIANPARLSTLDVAVLET
jgi:RNA polymerase sigma-70 factor (ECF subfamily)